MDSINNYIKANVSKKRLAHIYGVAATAKVLAVRYGADEKKAETAALFHDMCKGMTTEKLNEYVVKFNLDKKYIDNKNLSHGKVAGELMKRDFHVYDEDVINAVKYHTTGRKNMSLLEKIIYLSDAIEPERDYPTVETIRKMAQEDLDKACLTSMNRSIEYIKSKGDHLDEDTLKAKEVLEGELNGN
ncbi:MAG: bis(5'-nucleosyl)-tetraphosphatase (symmetrical) YqeK [Anaerovoracaceae bacterium]